MYFSRDTTQWKTAQGKTCLIKDLADDHVLNIIGHLVERLEVAVQIEGQIDPFLHARTLSILDLIEEEIKIRNLGFYYTMKKLELMPWQAAFTGKDGNRYRYVNGEVRKL